jgi:ankyrin repeat protein
MPEETIDETKINLSFLNRCLTTMRESKLNEEEFKDNLKTIDLPNIVNQPMNDFGDTLLHLAVKDNNLKATQLILRQTAARIDAKNVLGNTPLHEAIKANNTGITSLLILNGASLETKNLSGRNAREIADDSGNTQALSEALFDADEIQKKNKLKNLTNVVNLQKALSSLKNTASNVTDTVSNATETTINAANETKNAVKNIMKTGQIFFQEAKEAGNQLKRNVEETIQRKNGPRR